MAMRVVMRVAMPLEASKEMIMNDGHMRDA